MDFVIISIDHSLQLLEAETDSPALLASKVRLREILEEQFAAGSVAEIFEESALQGSSIAAQMADSREPLVPWHNISMTTTERRKAGIYEALRNRPSRPDENWEFSIVKRIPEDEPREDYFADRILSTEKGQGSVLVLLGDMHVQAVANRLRGKGHTVEVRFELIPDRRWE